METHSQPIQDLLATYDTTTLQDSQTLIELMRRITNAESKIWNDHTIGFGEYHFKYDSGREGDSQILSFYPRKGKLTVYLMDGTARYSDLLSTLGAHATTGYCVVVKNLSDIDLSVLEQILQQSYEYISELAQSGPIDRILWKSE